MLLHLPRLAGHGSAPRTKNGPALAGHGAEAVRDAIARTIVTLPQHLRRSLTWDQGAEMAQHARLRIDAGVQVYFCDPQSPWQRGTNENTNGLLRQYFPKGTDLTVHSAEEIGAVAAISAGEKIPHEAAGEPGCAGVKLRQQMVFVGNRQGPGDEGRGAIRSGSLCGSD